ncbi:MAG: hypothetical protein ACLQJF_16110, partial [Candidatus Sulfotelmatobacter sp.]
LTHSARTDRCKDIVGAEASPSGKAGCAVTRPLLSDQQKFRCQRQVFESARLTEASTSMAPRPRSHTFSEEREQALFLTLAALRTDIALFDDV